MLLAGEAGIAKVQRALGHCLGNVGVKVEPVVGLSAKLIVEDFLQEATNEVVAEERKGKDGQTDDERAPASGQGDVQLRNLECQLATSAR